MREPMAQLDLKLGTPLYSYLQHEIRLSSDPCEPRQLCTCRDMFCLMIFAIRWRSSLQIHWSCLSHWEESTIHSLHVQLSSLCTPDVPFWLIIILNNDVDLSHDNWPEVISTASSNLNVSLTLSCPASQNTRKRHVMIVDDAYSLGGYPTYTR